MARLARLLLQEMENIGANLGGIRVPTLQPVTIYLPGNRRKLMPLCGTPLANCRMGLEKLRVWPKVNGVRDASAGQLGALNLIVARKSFRYLRANLDRPLSVQIQ